MNGLELSEKFCTLVVAPMISENFPELVPHMAAGLVGEGSECFGYDDELSRDHDWGAAICLWLDAGTLARYGQALHKVFETLPVEFQGFPVRTSGRWSEGRVGVLETGQFYSRFLGLERSPKNHAEWLAIPEAALAAATNGRVFFDHSGVFSRIRNTLLAHYPEDVRLKKLAAACAKMAQSGQYNYPRCLARKETVAATLALSEFIEAACFAVFLLNKRYRPFYKWMHGALPELPLLGETAYRALHLLAAEPSDRAARIEELCAAVAETLLRKDISDATGDFLLDHAVSVQEKIQDDFVRNLHLMAGLCP
jgi:hypothetical protein